jgi:hypothetical protein
VRELITNCLAKDKKNRLHDIGDARIELERAIREPREPDPRSGAARPWWRSAGGVAVASLAAIAAMSLAAAALLREDSRPTSPSPATPVRAHLSFPEGLTLPDAVRAVAVSPHGTQVAVLLKPKAGVESQSLYVRDLSRLEFRPLPGTDGATFPFWSPDGKSIAFFADRKLKRLDLSDGIVRVLCDAPAGRGGSWSSKGTIVFAPSAGGGLMIVSDSGGAPTPITPTTTPGESHRLPQMMPDGERFLYYVQNTAADGVYAFDPATKESRLVLPGWGRGVLSGAGHADLCARRQPPGTAVRPGEDGAVEYAQADRRGRVLLEDTRVHQRRRLVPRRLDLSADNAAEAIQARVDGPSWRAHVAAGGARGDRRS